MGGTHGHIRFRHQNETKKRDHDLVLGSTAPKTRHTENGYLEMHMVLKLLTVVARACGGLSKKSAK